MPIDPVISAALISGGSSLLGNLLNFGGTMSSNSANYKIAQMNNQYNAAMFQKQMDYNTRQWNAQNAYNTPLNQRKRYEQAGINPYMVLGNIQAGQAGSAGGVTPPTAQPVTMQAPQFDFSGIGQAVQSYVANRIVEKRNNASIAVDEAKANQINIENKYKAAELASSIWKKIEETRDVRHKRIYQQMLNNTFDQQFSTDMRQKEADISILEATAREKELDIALKEIHKSQIPKQYQLTFASIAADTLLKKAQENLTWEEAYETMQKAFKEQADAYGIRLNNNIIEKTTQSIIDISKTNANFAPYEKGLNMIIDSAREIREWVPNKSPKSIRYSTSYNNIYNNR